MLVLTRKQAETIKLGNDIVIKVIQTSRGKVKLGIDAPAHVRVLRGELAEFATAPSPVANNHRIATAAETAGMSDPLSEDECYDHLCERLAVEVEDLMMCVGVR